MPHHEPTADDDLAMMRRAELSVNMGMWVIEGCRPAAVERAAELILKRPDRHPEEVLDWALDVMDWRYKIRRV